MMTDRRYPSPRELGRALASIALLIAGAACSDHAHGPGADHDHGEGVASEPWAVTAWGERYEIFPEVDPLVAGALAVAHTHVTVLDGFAPLGEGRVAIVLRDAAGGEESFAEESPKRPGIFAVEVAPARAGEYELLFRVESAAGFEEIVGGRVRVGTAANPGRALDAPEPPADEIPFLKEQQWQAAFATAWTEAGELQPGISVPARVVPRPGGDRVLTAPASGRLEGEPWPYPGLTVRRGAPVFRLVPWLDENVSLAEREATVAALEAELGPAAARAERQERLASEGVVSREGAELAAGERDALAARLAGARRDVETARRARSGDGIASEILTVSAPFDGRVATVEATAGQSIDAGAAVAHFVATGGWWLELALPPRVAAALAPGPLELALRPRGGEPVRLAPGAARLVSIAPEVDPASGRIVALVELPHGLGGFAAGEAVEVELAGGEPRRGIVAPETALVDDAGVAVVYVQSSGEGFLRREVRVVGRRSGRVLVEGLRPGERLVTLGGAAIRRSTLVSSGVADGHVH
jgi:membrane fusion protein, heavy metal efflux system